MNHTWMVLLLVGLPVTLCGARELKVVNEWANIDFVFPSEKVKQDAIARRDFIPGNVVPIDVDVHYKVLGYESRVFVTFPRFREGIPVTLGFRSNTTARDGTPLFQPYPDYSWHENPTTNCNNKIVSTFRIAIDECQRLWVMDTGKIGLASSPQVCPPKILVFNLNTNQLIHRYLIPENQYDNNSLFINPIVDVIERPQGNCDNSRAIAYIADVAEFAILVYDSATDSSWRVRNKLMYPYPSFGTHTISGETFELMDGIFGMAIERRKHPDRSFYFHALAAEVENVVPVGVLNNRTAWESDEESFPRAFKVLGPKGSQSAASAIDANGNLFFGLNNINAIACYDTSVRPLTRNAVKTLVKDDLKLQFSSGMKVIMNTDHEEELWVVTNRFQKIFLGTMNNREVNFRIQAQRISKLLGGARCK